MESPYETYGEIIDKLGEDDYLFYSFIDKQLVVIDEKDGRHYQFSTVVDDSVLDAYSSLEFMDDDYDQQVYDLLRDIEIEDCIDFTDFILNEDQLSSCIGKNILDMVDDGFELNGWSFFEDNNYVYAAKDLMTYKAEVEIPSSFVIDVEFEYEDLYDFMIKGVEFDSVEHAALPMK